MSVKAVSASARIASRGTTTTVSPSTVSTRSPSVLIFRYGVKSLPSGNSGVCLYGGVGWAGRGAFMERYLVETGWRLYRNRQSHHTALPWCDARTLHTPSPRVRVEGWGEGLSRWFSIAGAPLILARSAHWTSLARRGEVKKPLFGRCGANVFAVLPPPCGSGLDIDQRFADLRIDAHDQRIEGEFVAGGDLLHCFGRIIDVRRRDQSVGVGVRRSGVERRHRAGLDVGDDRGGAAAGSFDLVDLLRHVSGRILRLSRGRSRRQRTVGIGIGDVVGRNLQAFHGSEHSRCGDRCNRTHAPT